MIHNSSIIDKNAKISKNVKVGPFCYVGPGVELSENVELISNVHIEGDTKIGFGTKIFPFASIGTQPQDLKFKGEKNSLVVGRNNIIREYVTINPGTAGGGSKTIIGDFPPSSNEIAAKLLTELIIIFFAASSPPVKEILEILGCEVNASPHGEACPVIILTTPGGIPDFSINFPNSSIGAEACSEHLSTIVFPAANAGAIFTATKNN